MLTCTPVHDLKDLKSSVERREPGLFRKTSDPSFTVFAFHCGNVLGTLLYVQYLQYN